MSKRYKHTNLLLASSKIKRTEESKTVAPLFPTPVKSNKTAKSTPTQAKPVQRTSPPVSVPVKSPPKDQIVVFWNTPFGKFSWLPSLIDHCTEMGYSTLNSSHHSDVIENVQKGRIVTALINVVQDPEKSLELLSDLNNGSFASNLKVLLIGGPPPSDLPTGISDKLSLKWLPASTQVDVMERSFIDMIMQPITVSSTEPTAQSYPESTPSPRNTFSGGKFQSQSQQSSQRTISRPTPPETISGGNQPQNRDKTVEDLLTDFLEKPQQKPEPRPTIQPSNPKVQKSTLSEVDDIDSAPKFPDTAIPARQPSAPRQQPPQKVADVGNVKPSSPERIDQSINAVKQPPTSDYQNLNTYDHAVKVLSDQFAKIESKEPIDLNALYQVAGMLVKDVGVVTELELRALNRREFNALPNRMVNTAIFALIIAKRRQFSVKQLEKMTVAALTHDFGMSLVPQEVLSKPGNLTSSEVKLMRKHPEHSCKLIKDSATKMRVPVDPELLDIVFQVHERMNGKGYPQGLPGNQIHPLARTLAVADVFEAFSHPRTYRRTFVAHEAIQEVARLSGVELDSDAVKTLVKELSMFPIDSHVMLNNGEIGKVIAINRTHPLRPVVEILFNNQKKRLKKPRREDLKVSPFLYISRTLFEKDLPE